MTLCVGLVEGGRCYIGADSMAVDDSEHRWTLCEPKCWEMGGMVWADAGPILPAQMLQTMDVPPVPEDGIHAWVTTVLTPAIRACLEGAHQEDDRSDHEILIGIRGKFCVISAETWEAAWCDEPVAIGHPPAVAAARGSLHATAGLLGVACRERITTALEAGALVSPFVGPPWSFVGV